MFEKRKKTKTPEALDLKTLKALDQLTERLAKTVESQLEEAAAKINEANKVEKTRVKTGATGAADLVKSGKIQNAVKNAGKGVGEVASKVAEGAKRDEAKAGESNKAVKDNEKGFIARAVGAVKEAEQRLIKALSEKPKAENSETKVVTPESKPTVQPKSDPEAKKAAGSSEAKVDDTVKSEDNSTLDHSLTTKPKLPDLSASAFAPQPGELGQNPREIFKDYPTAKDDESGKTEKKSDRPKWPKQSKPAESAPITRPKWPKQQKNEKTDEEADGAVENSPDETKKPGNRRTLRNPNQEKSVFTSNNPEALEPEKTEPTPESPKTIDQMSPEEAYQVFENGIEEVCNGDTITILNSEEDLREQGAMLARKANNLNAEEKGRRYLQNKGVINRVRFALSKLKDRTLSRVHEFTKGEEIREKILQEHGHLGVNIDVVNDAITTVMKNDAATTEMQNSLNAVLNIKRLQESGEENEKPEIAQVEGEEAEFVRGAFVEAVKNIYEGLQSGKAEADNIQEANLKLQQKLQSKFGKTLFRTDLLFKANEIATKGFQAKESGITLEQVLEAATKKASGLKIETGHEVLDRQVAISSKVTNKIRAMVGDSTPIATALTAGVLTAMAVGQFTAERTISRAAGVVGGSALVSGLLSGLRELKTQKDNIGVMAAQGAIDSNVKPSDGNPTTKLYEGKIVQTEVGQEIRDYINKTNILIEKINNGDVSEQDAQKIKDLYVEFEALKRAGKDLKVDLILESGLGNATKQMELFKRQNILKGAIRESDDLEETISNKTDAIKDQATKIIKDANSTARNTAIKTGARAAVFGAGVSAVASVGGTLVGEGLKHAQEHLSNIGGIRGLFGQPTGSSAGETIVNEAQANVPSSGKTAEEVAKANIDNPQFIIQTVTETTSVPRENVERFLVDQYGHEHGYSFENPDRYFHNNGTVKFDGKELQMHQSGSRIDVSGMIKHFGATNWDGTHDRSFDSIKANFEGGQIRGGQLLFNFDGDAKDSVVAVPVNPDGTVTVTGPLGEMLEKGQFKTAEFVVKGDAKDHVLATIQGNGAPSNFNLDVTKTVEVPNPDYVPPTTPSSAPNVVQTNSNAVPTGVTSPGNALKFNDLPPANSNQFTFLPGFGFANGPTPATFHNGKVQTPNVPRQSLQTPKAPESPLQKDDAGGINVPDLNLSQEKDGDKIKEVVKQTILQIWAGNEDEWNGLSSNDQFAITIFIANIYIQNKTAEISKIVDELNIAVLNKIGEGSLNKEEKSRISNLILRVTIYQFAWVKEGKITDFNDVDKNSVVNEVVKLYGIPSNEADKKTESKSEDSSKVDLYFGENVEVLAQKTKDYFNRELEEMEQSLNDPEKEKLGEAREKVNARLDDVINTGKVNGKTTEILSQMASILKESGLSENIEQKFANILKPVAELMLKAKLNGLGVDIRQSDLSGLVEYFTLRGNDNLKKFELWYLKKSEELKKYNLKEIKGDIKLIYLIGTANIGNEGKRNNVSEPDLKAELENFHQHIIKNYTDGLKGGNYPTNSGEPTPPTSPTPPVAPTPLNPSSKKLEKEQSKILEDNAKNVTDADTKSNAEKSKNKKEDTLSVINSADTLIQKIPDLSKEQESGLRQMSQEYTDLLGDLQSRSLLGVLSDLKRIRGIGKKSALNKNKDFRNWRKGVELSLIGLYTENSQLHRKIVREIGLYNSNHVNIIESQILHVKDDLIERLLSLRSGAENVTGFKRFNQDEKDFFKYNIAKIEYETIIDKIDIEEAKIRIQNLINSISSRNDKQGGKVEGGSVGDSPRASLNNLRQRTGAVKPPKVGDRSGSAEPEPPSSN